MTHLNEAALQDSVIKKIKEKYHPYVWIYKSHDLCTVGIPDMIMCLHGHFIAIELKTDKRSAKYQGDVSHLHVDLTQKASPLQKYNVKQINDAGGSAFIGYNVEQIKDKIERILASLKYI